MNRPVSLLLPIAALAIGGLAWAAPAKQAPKKGGRWRPAVHRDYKEAARRWHSAEGLSPVLDDQARPKLVLSALNTGEKVELRAASDEGGFDAANLELAAGLLRDPRTGLRHPVEPRALDLVYRAMRHFSAPEVRVISGYRAPVGGGQSNHGRGRAIDLVLPGVADAKLSEWGRTLGFTGVGLYPNGGFCHLDVRPRSYFWVDTSGPGQRNRESPVHAAQAAKSDASARERRAPPPAFLLPGGDVEAAFRGSAAAAPDDDHDMEDDADGE